MIDFTNTIKDDILFEEKFLEWYDNGKKENNFRELYGVSITQYLIESFYSQETLHGEPSRWSIPTTKVVPIKDRFFFIKYDKAATEMQEDYYEYDNSIQECEQKEKVVLEWVTKEN